VSTIKAEVAKFLMQSIFTGKLATVKKDGSPHVVPIWFVMETISRSKERGKGLPILNKNLERSFEGYDASLLMSETAKLRSLITKRGTLEILIPPRVRTC
jgi:hypothetical protein